MLLMLFFVVMTPLILIMLNSIFFSKETMSQEKSSPFECGFEPKFSSRTPFSIRFYLLAIIFLIFDIEITLLMPISISLNNTSMWSHSFISLLFLTILILGLLHEWKQGALKWTN